uniref:Cellular retinoic acid-binding protein 2 n=2 Tax=Bursaphelenchus xylophilus TaxID=6326 RepID=A0A1I7SP50_BURXY
MMSNLRSSESSCYSTTFSESTYESHGSEEPISY